MDEISRTIINMFAINIQEFLSIENIFYSEKFWNLAEVVKIAFQKSSFCQREKSELAMRSFKNKNVLQVCYIFFTAN